MSAGGSNEPNLTPFIDLFSVLICFLLMTAAWIQLESVQVQIEKKPPLTPDASLETPPPPEPPKKVVKLSLHLYANRIVAAEDEKEKVIMIDGQNVESDALETIISGWRQRFDSKQMLALHSGEKATYGQMIHLYDFVTRLGWAEVGINPYDDFGRAK